MKKKQLNFIQLGGLLALSVLLSCTAPNNINKVTPTPASAQTAQPVATPTTVATNTPAPTATASQEPVPTASTGAAGTPTPNPTPTNVTTDISDRATLNGKVFDEGGNPLSDIKVTLKSLETNVPLVEETTTSNGTYVFRNIPVGIRLQVDVFKNDTWTRRNQSIILKSNLFGDTTSNVLDFGDTHSTEDPQKENFQFISDAPEVVSITPNRNTRVKHFGFSVKMVFSEPVVKETIEKNLIIRYINSEIGPQTAPGDGTNGTADTDGPPALFKTNQIIIAKDTEESFFTWDDNNVGPYGKEVTFSLHPYEGIPTSPRNRTLYSISLRNRAGDVRIRDIAGNIGINFGEFFIESKRSKNIVIFVDADKDSPYLEDLKLERTNNNCIIKLNFSEPMTVQNVANLDLTNLAFYKFYKNNSPITLQDVSFRLLTPNFLEIYTRPDTFERGDVIKVEVDPNLKDPVGNFFSQGVTLGERDYIKELRFNP